MSLKGIYASPRGPCTRYLLGLAILLGMATHATHLEAQQRGEAQRTAPKSIRAHPTKAELAGRFQLLKEQYGTIKTRVAKFVPLQPTHPPDVKQARAELDSNMRAFEAAEREIQTSMDAGSELSETESLRLQMAMDRLSKLMETLANVLKKISDTGEGITQNFK
jgi:hypothetical protein